MDVTHSVMHDFAALENVLTPGLFLARQLLDQTEALLKGLGCYRVLNLHNARHRSNLVKEHLQRQQQETAHGTRSYTLTDLGVQTAFEPLKRVNYHLISLRRLHQTLSEQRAKSAEDRA